MTLPLRSRVAVLVAIAALSVLGYALFHQPQDRETPPRNQPVGSNTTPKSISPTPLGVIEQSGNAATIKGAGHDWSTLLRGKSPEARNLLDLDPQETRKDFDAVLAKGQQGDTDAALALYRLAVSCGVVDGYGSTRRPRGDAQRPCVLLATMPTSPRDWLVSAAQTNDDALLPLLSMARELSRAGDRPADAAVAAGAAVAATEKSAQRGNPEAYLLLGRTYSDGLVVQADAAKAFAYYDVYTQAFGDPAIAKEAQRLEKLLRAADMAAVRDLQRKLQEAVVRYRSQPTR